MSKEKKYVGNVGQDKLFLIVNNDSILLTRSYRNHRTNNKFRCNWKFNIEGRLKELVMKLLPEEDSCPISGYSFEDNNGQEKWTEGYFWYESTPPYASSVKKDLFQLTLIQQYQFLLYLGHILTTKIFDEFDTIQIDSDDLKMGRMPLTAIEEDDDSLKKLYKTIRYKPLVKGVTKKRDSNLLKIFYKQIE